LNLAKCGIDILVGYFGLANGGNLNIGVKAYKEKFGDE
jgi:hypothetical protein